MMQETETTVRGLTGNIAALQFGGQSGFPALCLHGWLDNASSFTSVCRAIPGHRWISIDLPGHGHSAHRPPGCIYHFTDYVADVHRVVKNLGFHQFNLIGHSLGAGIAAAVAASFPARVNRLVLIDGIGPISGEDDDTLDQFRKSMAFLDDGESLALSQYRSWDALVDKRLRAGRINRSSVETLLHRGTFRRKGKIMVRSDPRLKQHSPIYMSQDKVVSILQGISAPTLLILAKDGLVISRKSTNRRLGAIPGLVIEEVHGHHHVHMDYPERVAPLIERFIRPPAASQP